MGRAGTGLLWCTFLAACAPEGRELGTFALHASLEDQRPDGTPNTPSTQSFLRGHHWLEGAEAIHVVVDGGGEAQLTLHHPSADQHFSLERIPLAHLVPRLHYPPASPPDSFDAFNLMMAEYARNGISVPVGRAGDTMSHFRTTLHAEAPWQLGQTYTFVPEPLYRPFRVNLVNNCLQPGLWELSATDRTGEIYHGWFTFDTDAYYELVARTNGLPVEFVADATAWRTDTAGVDLERLRTVVADIGEVPVSTSEIHAPVGYSSQDSRQKLGASFVEVSRDGEDVVPQQLSELVSGPVSMVRFVPPGKYSITERRTFDLTFLASPRRAEVRQVAPKTRYRWRSTEAPADHEDAAHLELVLDFGEIQLIAGNLPLPLLVQQEEYAIHGFGVGVLAAQDFAERRALLLASGPAPAYAYLVRAGEDGPVALNSHDLGLEQLFVRTRPFDAEPHFEVTLTSYERIVDVVKFRVGIPDALLSELRTSSEVYVSPLYFTYADHNVL